MARHILERNPGLSYEGLDFSEVFFAVSGQGHRDRSADRATPCQIRCVGVASASSALSLSRWLAVVLLI
jgi:hypothetical protein